MHLFCVTVSLTILFIITQASLWHNNTIQINLENTREEIVKHWRNWLPLLQLVISWQLNFLMKHIITSHPIRLFIKILYLKSRIDHFLQTDMFLFVWIRTKTEVLPCTFLQIDPFICTTEVTYLVSSIYSKKLAGMTHCSVIYKQKLNHWS